MVDYGELHQGLRSEKIGRALSIGSNVVNDSHFRVLSPWWRVYGNKIKRNRKKLTVVMVGTMGTGPFLA